MLLAPSRGNWEAKGFRSGSVRTQLSLPGYRALSFPWATCHCTHFSCGCWMVTLATGAVCSLFLFGSHSLKLLSLLARIGSQFHPSNNFWQRKQNHYDWCRLILSHFWSWNQVYDLPCLLVNGQRWNKCSGNWSSSALRKRLSWMLFFIKIMQIVIASL